MIIAEHEPLTILIPGWDRDRESGLTPHTVPDPLKNFPESPTIKLIDQAERGGNPRYSIEVARFSTFFIMRWCSNVQVTGRQ